MLTASGLERQAPRITACFPHSEPHLCKLTLKIAVEFCKKRPATNDNRPPDPSPTTRTTRCLKRRRATSPPLASRARAVVPSRMSSPANTPSTCTSTYVQFDEVHGWSMYECLCVGNNLGRTRCHTRMYMRQRLPLTPSRAFLSQRHRARHRAED